MGGKFSATATNNKKKLDVVYMSYKQFKGYLDEIAHFVENPPKTISELMDYINSFAMYLQLYHKHVNLHVKHNGKTDVYDFIFSLDSLIVTLKKNMAIMGYAFIIKQFATIAFEGLEEADDIIKNTQYDQFYYPIEMHCNKIAFLIPEKLPLETVFSLTTQSAQLNLNVLGDQMEKIEHDLTRFPKVKKLFFQRVAKKTGIRDAIQAYYDQIMAVQDKIGFFKDYFQKQ